MVERTSTDRLTRRGALQLLAAGAGATAVACTPATSGGSTTSEVQKPVSGGTLRLAIATDVDNPDPHRLGVVNTGTLSGVYDRVAFLDIKTRQPQPMLAESWDWAADAKSLRLNLKKGVQFHSGRELTSDDIKDNIVRMKDPKSGVPQLLYMANWFSSIETPDKSTVILKSEQPRPAVWDMFEYMNITDLKTLNTPDGAKKSLGTGAFQFVEWVPKDHWSFKKNPSYWQFGQPYLDAVVFTFTPDPQAGVTQFEAGAQDGVLYPPSRDAVRLEKDSKYRLERDPVVGSLQAMAVNTTLPGAKDKRVRQALQYATDRRRYADSVLQGLGGESRQLPWAQGSPAYDAEKNKRYPFDLDKAKALMAQAGNPETSLDFVYSNVGAEIPQLAQIIQADYAKIGVKVNIQPVEAQTATGRANQGLFGITGGTYGFTQLEPSTVFGISNVFLLSGNTSRFESPQLTQLVRQSEVEVDLAKRKALYSQINDLLLDESFMLPVSHAPWTLLVNNNVKGISWHVGQTPTYRTIWIAK